MVIDYREPVRDKDSPSPKKKTVWGKFVDLFQNPTQIPYWNRFTPWFYFVIMPLVTILTFVLIWIFLL
jgi:hypothetical protein